MFARGTRTPAAHRRGVVLILVLAMLGLLAVIGVSFATFSSQARKGAEQYSKRINRPNIDELLESAIAQLINDSTNPMSAIYGHGLLRDMYGNDASTNGFYNINPNGRPPKITSYRFTPPPPTFDAPEVWVVTTNIPGNVGRDFLYWTLSLPPVPAASVAGTYQVVGQDIVGGFYEFRLSGTHKNQLRDYTTDINGDGITPDVDAIGNSLITLPMTSPPPPNEIFFTLDGRYRRAFNGRGMAGLNGVTGGLIGGTNVPVIANGNTLAGQFGNFRVSGGLLQGIPDAVAPFDAFDVLGVDEDYDAPDLENWFLAVQSADGSISVPSFHRPGILVDHKPGNLPRLTDLNYPAPSNFAPGTYERRVAVRALSKILTLRAIDHPTANFNDPIPDPTTGQIVYPVDNDGDGTPESVWLDLGFPPQRAEDGTLFKPLFSFLVLGLNGKLPLNTAGNLNARVDVDDPTFPTNPTVPYTTPGIDESGRPLFDHASHLGASPSEINPRYALQNGPPSTDSTYSNNPEWSATASGVISQRGGHQQFDDAVYPTPDPVSGLYFRHIPVSLTQLRNLLSGTRTFDPSNPVNGDRNTVSFVIDPANGTTDSYPLPNNVINGTVSNAFPDGRDLLTGSVVNRTTAAVVAGRWGEPDAVTPTLASYNAPAVVPALMRALNYCGVDYDGDGVADSLNPVMAGRSPYAANQYRFDGIDDNYDTYDFVPQRSDPNLTANPKYSGGGPEAGPLLDNMGNAEGTPFDSIARDGIRMPLLPSERAQRDVTPRDTSGNGILSRFNLIPDTTGTVGAHNIGPDARGRVSFFHYFRPPGVPLDLDDASLGVNQRLIPNSNPTASAPSYLLANNRHNITRGYESYRAPAGNNAHHMGAMPYDRSDAGGGSPRDATGTAIPPIDLFAAGGVYVGTFTDATFPLQINSRQDGMLATTGAADKTTPVNSYPFGGLQFNDPNEMNLYSPNRDDAPFGPHDVEWLYRQQDVDGQSLQSRLADLAPISFVHSADASTRRRLFTDATWDRIEASFAHDNISTPEYPRGVGNIYDPTLAANVQPNLPPYLAPSDPARAPAERQRLPQYNARFPFNRSASIEALADMNPPLGVFTPQVFHGGRKINLNHPLPHSYDPKEPVRQKWITETYETLKLILPPQAIDTPQEVAKLGQYVVNIVDFRDPDNAITIWSNPDIVHRPAYRTTGGVDVPPSIHLPPRLLDGTIDPTFAAEGTDPLVHYGMEYQPVALNEVLAFQTQYADPGATGTAPSTSLAANVMYIELANTLTEAAGPASTASDLDLKGWDFLLVKEDPTTTYTAADPNFRPVYVRPDPITGQTPRVDTSTVTSPFLPEDATTATAVAGQVLPIIVGSGKSPDLTDLSTRKTVYSEAAAALDPPVDAIDADGKTDYTVLGGMKVASAPPADLAAITNDMPVPDKEFLPVPVSGTGPGEWDDFLPDTTDPAFNNPEGLYFWLYLRRPANPILPPDPSTNPMVVVDSIRFPFSMTDAKGETANVTSPPLPPNYQDRLVAGRTPTQPLYSIERPQPFRGGQIVPDPEDPTRPLFIYGTSLQARASREAPKGYGLYNTPAPEASGKIETTLKLEQTIDRQNNISTLSAGTPANEAWDFMPFNDRDFVSVAELMLVPACPPGLFTKQFAEVPPNVLAAYPPPQSPTTIALQTPPTATSGPIPKAGDPGVLGPIAHTQARTYPYLAHEFYYSSDPTYAIDPNGTIPPDPLVDDRGHIVGGPTAAGWHRMLGFFEVPAPNLGAIGPVAQGINLDWYRQDRRPGLINPNLIVDEEVFFGLVDDPRLLNASDFGTSRMPNAALPQVVTQVNVNGEPINVNSIANRGYTAFTNESGGITLAIDPLTGDDTSTSLNYPWSLMKVPFADFLKQRHGGSGFLFGFGDAQTAGYIEPIIPPYDPVTPRIPRDRPYRAMSYVDIQDSLLRPATLPPSPLTTLPANFNPTPPVGTRVVADPGLKLSQTLAKDNVEIDPGFVYSFDAATPTPSTFYANPVVDESGAERRPIYPGIPPRRLFQIPDASPPSGDSNASLTGIDYVPITNTGTGLFPDQAPLSTYLGGVDATLITDPVGPNQDMRRHPYYRTELIQKLTNLTTPRTHQFAVWLTVGFFEVAESGDRAQLVPDVMGPEIGGSSGKIERYRAFFVLDRSKATGYDPRNPGDYRDVVLYSRRIE